MYCVNCGVRLSDTEKKCPLCNTAVYHPDIKREPAKPLYPANRFPELPRKSGVLGGMIIILFVIAISVCLLSDWQTDRHFSWSGYATGGMILGYIFFCLPAWFEKPNPVIFLPCSFAAIIVFLLYVNFMLKGNWFLSFAFPVTGGFAVIFSAMTALLHYLKRGKLYVIGGTLIAIGVFMPVVEFLLCLTFKSSYIGWSLYPLATSAPIGVLLIYLAINRTAREIMERKLFF